MIVRHKREWSVLAAYAALLLALAAVAPDFYRRSQFRDTWVDAAPLLVMAVGMTMVILTRHVDISVGSQFSVCAVAAGLLAGWGLPLPLVVVGTLAAGAMMGAVNGSLVALAGLPSIVVTLATMVVLRGMLLWASGGAAIELPRRAKWFGSSQQTGEILIVGTALAVLVAGAFALRWLAAGRAVYAVGSDQEAARLAGVRPRRVVFSVFALTGALAGLAALLSASRFNLVYPNTGEGKELLVIAAVVIGGTSVAGGRGTLLGSLIGVALLATVGPALQFFRAEPYWAKAIQGAVILAAVASDGLRWRQRAGATSH